MALECCSFLEELAKPLTWGSGDHHRSILSLCAAQAGPRQAAELGLPLAVAAPKAGAGWEHTTEEHATGNAQFCEREKADLQTLKVPVSEKEKPIPSSFSSAKRQVFGEAEMIQQGTNKGTWEGVLAEGGC